ncbi:MAG: 1-acyl-sn-glycerol-3-phosphate acyltransferase [Anaerolineae bacterium]|nr:1-acyl-sn-glycerol-3-phosphate acyltransferase [Anaerolineae bacterium]
MATTTVTYPRRRLIRELLQRASRLAFSVLVDMEIEGRENLPTSGPLIVVGNHFSFLDPAVLVGIAPWPLEFLGGMELPNAPPIVRWIPRLWGYYPVLRGGNSRRALRAAEAVLKDGGIVGVFPEAGNWAQVLRPARPGTAHLAARTGAPLLPIGYHGLPQVFEKLRERRRARVTVRIGKPFGPFRVAARGRERRRILDGIGHEIMARIAALIPDEKRGYLSSDPAVREAAKGTEIYPWDKSPEGA